MARLTFRRLYITACLVLGFECAAEVASSSESKTRDQDGETTASLTVGIVWGEEDILPLERQRATKAKEKIAHQMATLRSLTAEERDTLDYFSAYGELLLLVDVESDSPFWEEPPRINLSDVPKPSEASRALYAHWAKEQQEQADRARALMEKQLERMERMRERMAMESLLEAQETGNRLQRAEMEQNARLGEATLQASQAAAAAAERQARAIERATWAMQQR